MKFMELKIAPPVLFAMFAAAMYFLSKDNQFDAPMTFRVTALVVLDILGLSFSIAGLLKFRGARTTIDPRRPEATTTLVTTGIYRFSRNPMYVGQVLIISGWAVYQSSIYALLLIPCFAFYLNQFQILPEERILEALFGEDYLTYKKQVRRWL